MDAVTRTSEPSARQDVGARSILVIDDSRTERLLLRSRLMRAGYDVTEAASGSEGAELLSGRSFPLILTDWMMPGRSGPELCRWLRAHERETGALRSYVVLLTAKDSAADVAEGLDAGADEFLSKPVSEGELSARLNSGFRLFELQSKLAAQAGALSRAYDSLKSLYDRIDADLRAASKLQHATVPPAHAVVQGLPVAIFYRPIGHVGGDHVGYVQGAGTELGLFSIDVSGHGIASALEAVRLAQMLSSRRGGGIITEGGAGTRLSRPSEAVTALNAHALDEELSDLYFTMSYASLDAATGEGRICRAGHTEALILRAGGAVEILTEGGPPVALFEGLSWPDTPFRLDPGDRLLLHSDALTEARRRDGELLEIAGLAAILHDLRALPTERMLPALVERVREMTESDFDDDVSALLVERPG